MRIFTLAVAISIAGLSSIPAGAQEDTARTRTFRRSTPAGQEVRIFTYTQHRSDCTPAAPPRVILREMPAHGKATIRPDSQPSGPPRFGAADCTGRIYLGTGIFYTPEPNFRGSDRFGFEATSDNGTAHDTAVVEVK